MEPSALFVKIFLVLLGISGSSLGEHVVFVQTCASYSHRVAHWPLAVALTDKGHNVTFISPYGPNSATSSPNVTEIQPQKLKAFMDELIQQNFDVNHRAYGLIPPLFLVLDYFCFTACHEMYKSPEIKIWLASNPQVDIVVSDMMPDCSYGLASKLGAKNILYLPIPMPTRHFESFGINPESSTVPDYDISKPVPLTFLNRVVGAILPLWYRTLEQIFYEKYKNLFAEELGLTNLPNVDDIRDLTCLILINGDYLTDYPRSHPSFVIKVPGIHLKNSGQHKKLNQEVEEFINVEKVNGNKTEGFMYVSFGTVAKASSLPIELRETFFKTFQSFPNIRFVWKWEGERPTSYPPNLHLAEWINQQDLLAHPKLKGFLTQAGRPSSQEAMYCGVPMITFPILADQDFNADRMVDLGISIGLDFVGLTEEKLTTAISQLLTDDSYKKRAVQIANLAKDVPSDPVHTSTWWVEYVMRHTKEELLLMKPLARHLTWYQKRDLDIWLFLLIILSISSYISFLILRKLYTYFMGRSNNNKKNKVDSISAQKIKKS